MLKGVNHRVVEIAQPESAYFEKVLFFVKPEFSDVSESRLRTKADGLIKDAAAPPENKNISNRKKKLIFFIKIISAAAAGALAASAGIIAFIS